MKENISPRPIYWTTIHKDYIPLTLSEHSLVYKTMSEMNKSSGVNIN